MANTELRCFPRSTTGRGSASLPGRSWTAPALRILTAIACLTVLPLDALASSNSDFDSGLKLVKERQFQKALNFLDKSVDAEPTNGDFHFWRGKCLSALGKKQDAGAEFKLAALLAPDNKLKELCRVELARYKMALPKGSVSSVGATPKDETSDAPVAPRKDDKYFKLSSKKLDWNLELRKDFLHSMKERNDRLAQLAKADNWRMPPRSNAGPPLLNLGAVLSGPAHHTAALSADEKKMLLAADIMIILDHSGSMQGRDCPAGNGLVESRLNWCVEELDNFAAELGLALPHGFHLIVFDTQPEVHHISGPAELHRVLQGLNGGGGTNLAAALEEAFRLHTAHPQQPLLIAVVTDAEIDVHSSERTILNATRRFPLPNGLFITLLQIGHQAEVHTQDQLNYLDKLDRNAGAAYDPFEGVPFTKVRADGLGRSILRGLRATAPSLTTTATVSPSKESQDPKKANADPLKPTAEPSKSSAANPSKPTADPSKPATDPSKPTTDPSNPSAADPPPVMWPAGSK